MTNKELEVLIIRAEKENSCGNYDIAEQFSNEVVEALDAHKSMLGNHEDENNVSLRTNVLLTLANTERLRCNFDNTLRLAQNALTLSEEFNLHESKAKAWNIIGLVHYTLGSYDKSLEYYGKAFVAFEECGEKSRASTVTMNIGNVYDSLGFYDKALEYYTKALATFEELNENSNIARVTVNIGNEYTTLSKYNFALECFGKAFGILEQLGEKSIIATCTGGIGLVYFNLGLYDKALEFYSQAYALHEKLGEKSDVAGFALNIGNVYFQLGDYNKSLEYYFSALATFSETGEKPSIADVTGNIGNIYNSLESYDKALSYYEKCLDIYIKLGEESSIAGILANIGTVYQSLGLYNKALENFTKSLAILEKFDEKLNIAEVVLNIGELFSNHNFEDYDVIKSEDYLLKALEGCEIIGAKHIAYQSHKSLAELYKQEKRWEECQHHFEKFYEIREEVQSEEAKKQAILLEQQKQIAEREKEIAIAKATASARLNATTELLHKVLPETIATRIIDGEKEIADYFPNVSILFADIAGFTPISAEMPAYIVIRFLNFIFQEFDSIMKKHGCEKIKTIGDGYMAVSGAPIACEDHAERMAAAAFEMMQPISLPDEIREHFPKGSKFSIRIGLHTGSVVAGVIGDNRFVYDIYSDAVNTASRMESHGEIDKIHVSADFALHLQNRFAMTKNTTHGIIFEKRNEMEIKGKGKMKTYFLVHSK